MLDSIKEQTNSDDNWIPDESESELKERKDLARRAGYDKPVSAPQEKQSTDKRKNRARKSSEDPATQITLRTRQSVIDRIYKIRDSQEPPWPNSYLLERAITALENEMSKK